MTADDAQQQPRSEWAPCERVDTLYGSGPPPTAEEAWRDHVQRNWDRRTLPSTPAPRFVNSQKRGARRRV